VLRPGVAERLRSELDDALVVRGLVPPASFAAVEHGAGEDGEDDDDEAAAPSGAVDGSVWLEAELERHLGLLADHDPAKDPGAGAEAMRILSGPLRALEAADALGGAKPLLADFAASVTAAGYDAGPSMPDGRVRREWVRFLRDRPAPWADVPPAATDLQRPDAVLGELLGRIVRVDELAWSPGELGIHVALRPRQPRAGGPVLDPDETAAWSLRAIDDRGRLHLGPSMPPIAEAGGGIRFRLRPGLTDGVHRLDLRLSARGRRLEGSVPL
jgi:hypothetical protein